ncbi:MAG TPA: FecR family protein [Steroidobacteraceae bacterium]
MARRQLARGALVVFSWALLVLAGAGARADGDDPPSRVARISFAEGSISFQPAGTQDWVPAPLNRPFTTGDVLWADNTSRAELQLDGSVVRLSNSSELTLVNLDNDVTQLQLSSGTLILHVRRLGDNETYEVDTPNLAFSVLRPGSYRISVDPSGNTTAIAVRSGQGEVSGGGSAYTLQSGDYDSFSGTDQLAAEAQPGPPDADSFDAWSSDRDSRWDHSASARYVSADVVGYQDLDDQGTWRETPEYGAVWYPNSVAAGWAPYQAGHWSYIAPWGYTWVDDQPWGFAPFHYGRWIWGGGAWGWIPCPPRPEHGPYIRPVYAPALVAWVGTGAAIAWFALGPREVFVPRYPVSPNYMHNINVSNTTVNTTVINNVYNTTIINNKTVDITYVNRAAPGAITATTSAAFTSAQPVSRNLVKVDQRELASAPIHPLAPALVPTKQAVLGSSRTANSKPPAAVLTRSVIARTPPPAAPPTFERRQEALKNNGGKPLSAEQVRQIQRSTAAPRTAAIRVAPPLSPVSLKPVAPRTSAQPPQRAPAANPPPPAAPRMPISHPAPAAIHANELPAPPKPASPSVAQSVIDREQLQRQQQMRAQQEQERQRMQQQQELEHQRMAQQQADAARAQELERQHQQQTQELQQRHIQEQQALQATQQEERRSAPPPAPPKPPEQHKPPEPHKPPQ